MSTDRRPNIGGKRKQFIAGAALAFMIYVSFTVLLTWPLVTGMNRYYFSPRSPVTARVLLLTAGTVITRASTRSKAR